MLDFGRGQNGDIYSPPHWTQLVQNSTVKEYVNLNHRKINKESRQHQKGEQLLIQGIRKTSTYDTLQDGLSRKKAAFSNPLPDPSLSSL